MTGIKRSRKTYPKAFKLEAVRLMAKRTGHIVSIRRNYVQSTAHFQTLTHTRAQFSPRILIIA